MACGAVNTFLVTIQVGSKTELLSKLYCELKWTIKMVHFALLKETANEVTFLVSISSPEPCPPFIVAVCQSMTRPRILD